MNNVISHFAIKDNDIVPMVYIGEQEFPGNRPEKLYNLVEPLFLHPMKSTLAESTIKGYGYKIV